MRGRVLETHQFDHVVAYLYEKLKKTSACAVSYSSGVPML